MEWNKDNPLRVATLCSGYDSQCLALEQIKEFFPPFDYDLVLWSEFDPESKQPLEAQPAVVAHNALFPQWADRNYGDMTKIDWENAPDIDLLFYSTPCQDFSNAGRQRGAEEGSATRSSILWYTRNAIIAKRPKYAIMENVKAVVSDKFIRLFRKWEQELASYGYTNYCKVLNAKDYGYPEPVPQNRERIFLVSVRDEDDHFRFPEPMELTKRLKDVLVTHVDERYYLDDEKVQKFVAHCDKKQMEGCGFKFEPSEGGG